MIMLLTMVGVMCAAAAGILVYRCGVHDGMRFYRKATRPRVLDPDGGAQAVRTRAVDTEAQRRQWQEMMNFMQYDGGEMPRANGGEPT